MKDLKLYLFAGLIMLNVPVVVMVIDIARHLSGMFIPGLISYLGGLALLVGIIVKEKT